MYICAGSDLSAYIVVLIAIKLLGSSLRWDIVLNLIYLSLYASSHDWPKLSF